MMITIDIPLKKNEDAPPRSTENYVIVCDGMGSGSYPVTFEGETHTSAFYGSRIVSKTVAEFYDKNHDRFFIPEEADSALNDLKRTISESLTRFANSAIIEKSSIRGSMFRLLPTTLSSILFQEEENTVETVTIWAGDSRAYVMDPENGLRQISDDDISSEDDPMQCLSRDPPMNNSIYLDGDFRLHIEKHTFNKPCLLFVASDGCFSYLRSPMHFEDFFLPPRNTESFSLSERLESILSRIQLDDRSLAGRCFGIEMDEQYSSIFRPRRTFMNENYYSKMEYDAEIRSLKKQLREAGSLPDGEDRTETMENIRSSLSSLEKKNLELLMDLWDDYKKTYDSLRMEYHQNRDKTSIEVPIDSTPASDKKAECIDDKSVVPIIDSKNEPAIASANTGENVTEKTTVVGQEDIIETPVECASKQIPDLGEIVTIIHEMTEVGGYTIIRDSIMEKSFYVEAKGRSKRGNKDCRLVFKPRSSGDIGRIMMFGKGNGFENICKNTKTLQAPILIELSDKYLMMGFDLIKYRRIQPQDIHKMKKSLLMDMTIQLFSALGTLHENNIIHGGIDKDNVEVWSGFGGQVICRINNYGRSFLKNGINCDFDLDPSFRNPKYDIDCLVRLLYRMRSPSPRIRECSEDELTTHLANSNDAVDRIFLQMLDKDNPLGLKDAISRMKDLRYR